MSTRRSSEPWHRRESVPEVEEWMAHFGAQRDAGTAADTDPDLAASAIRALRIVLSRPGRDRESAFALLAADGLLTAALEVVAMEEDDPEAGFRALLRRVVAEVDGASP